VVIFVYRPHCNWHGGKIDERTYAWDTIHVNRVYFRDVGGKIQFLLHF
jgi:hypothetical protein